MEAKIWGLGGMRRLRRTLGSMASSAVVGRTGISSLNVYHATSFQLRSCWLKFSSRSGSISSACPLKTFQMAT